jgi:hypothetical protein
MPKTEMKIPRTMAGQRVADFRESGDLVNNSGRTSRRLAARS